MRMRDDYGDWVTAGDHIQFSFGIPPVVADAEIVERSGKLVALTPGHSPSECPLRSLRRYVGAWFKVEVDG